MTSRPTTTFSILEAPSRADRPRVAQAAIPADRPGRWLGGVIGAVASLLLVPVSIVFEERAGGGLGTLAVLGLLGAPIAFVLGRQLLPAARADRWGTAYAMGVVLGFAAPPLGALEVVWLMLFVPDSFSDQSFRSPELALFLLVFAIPLSFTAIVVTIPVGIVWAVGVRLVPDELLARLRVPAPLDRLGVWHLVPVVMVGSVLVARAIVGAGG